MFERRQEPLLPRPAFVRRFLKFALAALAIIVVSLGVGILGYHLLGGLSWLDSFLNAAMILGGMGPVSELKTPGAKLFAACYALYSGIVFLVSVGVLLAPLLHRFLHHFHLEEHARADKGDRKER